MKSIIDNASGPTGIVSMGIAKVNDPDLLFTLAPSSPTEWLLCLSTGLVICQLIHWVYRFIKWYNKGK